MTQEKISKINNLNITEEIYSVYRRKNVKGRKYEKLSFKNIK